MELEQKLGLARGFVSAINEGIEKDIYENTLLTKQLVEGMMEPIITTEVFHPGDPTPVVKYERRILSPEQARAVGQNLGPCRRSNALNWMAKLARTNLTSDDNLVVLRECLLPKDFIAFPADLATTINPYFNLMFKAIYNVFYPNDDIRGTYYTDKQLEGERPELYFIRKELLQRLAGLATGTNGETVHDTPEFRRCLFKGLIPSIKASLSGLDIDRVSLDIMKNRVREVFEWQVQAGLIKITMPHKKISEVKDVRTQGMGRRRPPPVPRKDQRNNIYKQNNDKESLPFQPTKMFKGKREDLVTTRQILANRLARYLPWPKVREMEMDEIFIELARMETNVSPMISQGQNPPISAIDTSQY